MQFALQLERLCVACTFYCQCAAKIKLESRVEERKKKINPSALNSEML